MFGHFSFGMSEARGYGVFFLVIRFAIVTAFGICGAKRQKAILLGV